MKMSKTIWGLPFILLLSIALPAVAAAQKDEDEPTAILNFVVLKEDNGKPVRNAAVIMHSVSSHGKQGRGDLELKTDLDGKASFDGVPYGLLRVQVLASGFQTFGQDYDIKKDRMDFTIKLARPASQYSIYGNPAEKPDKKDDKSSSPDPNAKPQE